MLTINPLITDRIKNLSVPDTIKDALLDVLKTEKELADLNAKRNFDMAIHKVLESYADRDDVAEFCKRHE